MSPAVKDVIKKCLIAVLTIIIAALSAQGVADLAEKDEPTAVKQAPTVAPPVGDLQVEPEKSSIPGDPELTLKDETPDEIAPEVLDQAAKQNEDLAGTELGRPLPVGGAQNYTLRKKFDCGVWSNRSHPPIQFVLHFTVSPNRPGWSDVYGIHDYFCRTKIASSTYIMDFDCHTLQMVPESRKPWTQGAFNPTSISVEIIATGSETREQWLDAKLMRRGCLAQLARDSMRRNGIKILRVDPVGCVAKVGYTDHNALECGNDHTDVGRNFPWDKFNKQVKQDQCGKKCRVRRANDRNHAERRRLNCNPRASQSRGPRCTKLHRRHQVIHNRARALGVKF